VIDAESIMKAMDVMMDALKSQNVVLSQEELETINRAYEALNGHQDRYDKMIQVFLNMKLSDLQSVAAVYALNKT
jgi:predicted nucleotidyltransferase